MTLTRTSFASGHGGCPCTGPEKMNMALTAEIRQYRVARQDQVTD